MIKFSFQDAPYAVKGQGQKGLLGFYFFFSLLEQVSQRRIDGFDATERSYISLRGPAILHFSPPLESVLADLSCFLWACAYRQTIGSDLP